jgi:uncharacterized Ntn-hydrolase superfamily protein/acetylornithine deacetylase/succinyl-diaminopimelate desuccinylase-like protein
VTSILLLLLLQAVPPQPVATFSIVARDPETGAMGVAVQSHWFSVGSIVTWAEAGVGAVATQSFAREAYGPELLADLRAGLAPEAALKVRTDADRNRAVRQIAVVDAQGRVAAWTGPSCIASAQHVTGANFSCQANIMTDDGVVPAMAAAYESATGDLAERLMAALEAAQNAGGDLRGRQSAAILIVDGKRAEAAWQGVLVDLRVEDHPHPLVEMRRLLRIQRAYEAANRGDGALENGDLEAALAAYAEAEQLYPEQVELSFWRAFALLDRGHETEAFTLLTRVFAREPAWLEMPARLVAAGQLKADAALLARIAALAPAADLHRMVAVADAARIERDIRKLAGFGTRQSLSLTDDPQRGVGAARNWLKEEFDRINAEFHGGRLEVRMQAHQVAPAQRVPQGAEIVNVMGILPGSDPDRLVVLSGHYDSMPSSPTDSVKDAPGANDDASGTVAVLEAARMLGGLHPRATIVFLCVAGEEQGLLGSRAQAEAWKAEKKDVVGMFTMDIVGGAVGQSGLHEPWRLRVFSEGVASAKEGRPVIGSDNDSTSRQLARYFERAGEASVPGFDVTLIFRQDRYLRGGDHRSFNELGWPAVRLTEPHENYDHQHQDLRVENGVQYGDLPEFVDFAYVGRVARAVAGSVGELALAPAAPRGVQVDTTRLTPDTRLMWELAGEDAGVSGYAVLMRRTHEPTWTERRVVGRVGEVILDRISKDDWLFAVEAFNEAGHRSLPVYPTPRMR